jgi:hypothetical protein
MFINMWMDKEIMEYCEAIKRSENAATWMEFQKSYAE